MCVLTSAEPFLIVQGERVITNHMCFDLRRPLETTSSIPG
uniref:Uncharacterized protein n=1 Tax=Lepeophtheirus salmonis TaxID=72036 RepID=A0A0K2VKG8_LEPSM